MNRIKDNTIMTLSANVNCNLCNSNELKPFRSLPNYPINSLYVSDYTNRSKFTEADFKLNSCGDCNHIQGTSDFSLDEFYNDGYNNTNTGGQNRQNFFVDRLSRFVKNQKFNRVIDVGCNNLSLLKRLKSENFFSAHHWIGIDPVPLHKEVEVEDILFINGYLQDIQIPYADKALPDLIISDQTFEHIPNINSILSDFSKKISPNSTFAVCVPNLELIVEGFAFPSIYHEHLNYFSEYALANLFKNCNFSLQFSEMTADCWGLLFQIHILCNDEEKSIKMAQPINLLHKFQNNLESYERCLSVVRDILENTEGKIYGFGASDLTANFAYFLKSDLSMLDCIIDDTSYKENMYIPGLKPKIVKSADIDDWSDVTVLITAPQASRAILKRLIELNPKKIISPLNVF